MAWRRIREVTIALAALLPVTAVSERLLAQRSAPETLSGYMVDSKCYESAERSVNPWATPAPVSRDMDAAVKRCVPKTKTKFFGIVQRDWKMLTFDADGNAKATEFVRHAGKRDVYAVTVTGEIRPDGLKAALISAARD